MNIDRKEIRNNVLRVAGIGVIGAASLTGCGYRITNESAQATPTAGTTDAQKEALRATATATPIGRDRLVVVPGTPTAIATEFAKQGIPTAEATDFSDMLSMIPSFPGLVKSDPETKFVPNRVPMWFDGRDSNNPLNGLRTKVNAYSNSKGWGDITAKPGEWHYPLPIKNGNGETGSDTWAYAENIIKTVNASVYMKPGVTGQVWFRLPKGVTEGRMTAAYAVNENFVADKTGGDPDIVPTVIVRCPNNPGQSIRVRILDVFKDGRVIARKDGYIGLPKTDTDNLMVNLNPEAVTFIDFPVVDQTGNQREGMIELGSDAKQGPFFNPNLNRSTVKDVAKQLK